MISGLAGTILEKSERHVVIDVQGVRYEVQMSASGLGHLPIAGQPIEVWTRLIPSDDALTLFGFATARERQMFDLLRSVNGVGPRLALNILSSLSLQEIAQNVSQENPEAFLKVPRLGRKTAGKIILDLKNKIDEQFSTTVAGAAASIRHDAGTDLALQALLELGYTADEAKQALQSVKAKEPGDQVREALQQLGSHTTVSR